MNNKLIHWLLLAIFVPIIIISLSYFLFLSNPILFKKAIEKYNYQDYKINFKKVNTNKNPLYPLIEFEEVVLSKKNKNIKIDDLIIGLNLLGFFSNDLKILDYIKIKTSKLETQNYIALLPENSFELKNTILNLNIEGDIEEVFFEFINGSNLSINNELIISNLILNTGSDASINADKAFITANNHEVKAVLKNGSYENLSFESVSGLLDIGTMQLNYISYHDSINKFAENALPLDALNLQNDINLFTSGFIDFNSNKNRNLGFINFKDSIKTQYLKESFNIHTKIYIEDFRTVFLHNLISTNNLKLNLYILGKEIQSSSSFNFFSDKVSGIDLYGSLSDGNLELTFISDDIRGSIARDRSNFFRVDLYDSNINLDLVGSNGNNIILPNLKFRVTGENIIFNNAKFDSIDFYYLKNGDLLTLNDISIESDFLKISDYNNEPAYFSINTSRDFYKIKGSYEINGLKESLKLENFPSIEYFKSNINIQWNNFLELKNIEGKLDFLAKDFQINQNTPNSALLNLVGLLNIQSLFDGYDGSSSDEYIKFKRGSGGVIFSKKYGRIFDEFSFEADFGKMTWNGLVLKNDSGSLSDLDLELSLKISLQENIPWYAAIFGGLGVAAGTAIIGNVFEEQIDEISTLKYKVIGPLDNPLLQRL